MHRDPNFSLSGAPFLREALIALANVRSVLFYVTVAFEASAGLVADRFYREVNTVRNVCVVGIIIIIHAFVAPEQMFLRSLCCIPYL